MHVPEPVSQFADSFSRALGTAVIAVGTWAASQGYSKWQRRKDERNRSLKMLAKDHEIDVQVRIQLEILREKIGAIRTYVGKFHNGERFVDESHIQKLTRTHEAVAPGTTYTAEFYQSVLVSTVPEEVKLIRAEGESFTLVSKLHEGRFRFECERSRVAAIVRCAIKHGPDITGYIGADFDTITPPEKLSEVCRAAYTMGHLMQGQGV